MLGRRIVGTGSTGAPFLGEGSQSFYPIEPYLFDEWYAGTGDTSYVEDTLDHLESGFYKVGRMVFGVGGVYWAPATNSSPSYLTDPATPLPQALRPERGFMAQLPIDIGNSLFRFPFPFWTFYFMQNGKIELDIDFNSLIRPVSRHNLADPPNTPWDDGLPPQTAIRLDNLHYLARA